MYKVLIVEDEDIIRKGLLFLMNWQELNCTVVADCGTGEDGVAAIREYRPNIVITDINMPVVDGLEMIRRTHEEYEYSTIILSGYADFEYAQTAMRYGVQRYLLKPLNQNELKEAVMWCQRQCDERLLYKDYGTKKEKMLMEFAGESPIKFEVNDVLVRQMLDFVSDNYQDKIVMSDVVKKLNYSDTFLNKKFKEAMGTTFMDYVNRFRIQKAIGFILHQKMSLQEAAWRCGIGEYKYFSTVFKKYLGCSPREFFDEKNKN